MKRLSSNPEISVQPDGKRLYGGYTLAEEVWHIATHGAGALFGIVALVLMLIKAVRADDAAMIAAVSVYGASIILVFAASTLYHSTFAVPFRRVFELIDHLAIYIKIAGTYTPFALLVLPVSFGMPLLWVIWALAVAGIGLKLGAFLLRKENKLAGWSLGFYLAMGWTVLFVAGRLFDLMPGAAFAWMVAGGICYTLGALVYGLKLFRYSHTVWHFFVLAGSVCHFITVYVFVLAR
ncbi:MAG: hemolysin III family protein [Rhodothalassiaceae bacterium]